MLHFKAAFSPLISFQIKLATDLKKLNTNLASPSSWSSFYEDAFSWDALSLTPHCDFLFVCSKCVFPVASRQTSFPQVPIKTQSPWAFLWNGQRSPIFGKLTATAFQFGISPQKGLIGFHKLFSGYLLFFSFGNLTLKGLPRGPLLSSLI